MRRFFRFSAVALLLGATPGAFAHYYGWLPGSSTDSPQSGNRIAIVNLHTNATAGPTNGFQFTTESAEVDPLPPTFSPDGTYMSVAHDASPYITIYKPLGYDASTLFIVPMIDTTFGVDAYIKP